MLLLLYNQKARKCFTVKSCLCGKIHCADLVGMFFICYLLPIQSRLQSLNGIAILIVLNLFHCKVKCFNLNYPESGTAERQ